MRKFRRIMSRVGDVFCIVLMVLAVVLFVRQAWRSEAYYYSTADSVWCCESKLGQLRIGTWDIAAAPTAWHIFSDGWVTEGMGNRDFRDFNWWFAFDYASNGFYFGIPLWFLFLLFGIKPSWSLVAWRRRVRRLRKRMCVMCGYDLRGNPGAGTCPECGASISRAAPAAPPKSPANG